MNFKKILLAIIAAAFSLIYIVPLYMVVINSLKLKQQANLLGISWPETLRFDNYVTVFVDGGILRAFLNGVVISTGSVLIGLTLSSMASFYLSRARGRLPNFLYNVFIAGLIIPVAFIPTYLVLNVMDLIDTYAGLILISATYGLPMSIFLYTGFIKTIPADLEEAAIIDGCTAPRVFASVVFPLLKPVTMTLLVLNFIGSWNDVMVPLFFANSGKWALPLTIYNFYGAHMQSWNLIFADIIITISPLMLLYIFAQKYIISGMTAGAVKG